MPVTIQVAKHEARPVRYGLQAMPVGVEKTSQAVLEQLARNNASDIGPILRTYIGPQTSLRDEKLRGLQLAVEDHGLIRGAYAAYSDHHNLVLRPEDIWFAILVQFSYFVNAHAEDLRSSFVAHKGKKGLILRDPEQPDMGLMCRNMTKLIDENVVDPKLREWILPSFTTTTLNDGVVAAIIMMGTLQKYFDYVYDCSCCGIPTVTLLGEQSDWEDIQQRIEKLTEYGEEPTHLCTLLRPILSNMVSSFAKPDDPAIVDFWGRIIDRQMGSGSDTLSGWLVAFCFWDEDGRCLAKYGTGPNAVYAKDHTVQFTNVPAAFISVPVTYITPGNMVIKTKLLAGFVGFEATSKESATAQKLEEHQSPSLEDDASSAKGKPQSKTRRSSSLAQKILSKLCFRDSQSEVPESDTQVAKPDPAKSLTKASSSASSETGTEASVTGTKTSTANPQPRDTVRPVTGWWMYEVTGSKDSGMEGGGFLQREFATTWNGQASTGYVQADGQTVKVKEGLPEE